MEFVCTSLFYHPGVILVCNRAMVLSIIPGAILLVSTKKQDRKSAINGLISKSDNSDWLKIAKRILCVCLKIGTGQSSQFLALTKKIPALGDENDFFAYSVSYMAGDWQKVE